MNQIQLPKLRKIDLNRPKKKKILLMCDDVKFYSGVATAARELVYGTAHHYDWTQIAAATNHPDNGKKIDLSAELSQQKGTDCYFTQYCFSGYGNASVVREVIGYERPDAILIITDPRFWDFLFAMEHELHTKYKIPLIWWNIWDASSPYPFWNKSGYASMDMLVAINRQTKVINKEVLKYHGTETIDIDA